MARSASCAGFARPIHEIQDRPGVRADDRCVWIGREIADRGRMPVIAARSAAWLVHPLLHDGPSPSEVTTKACR